MARRLRAALAGLAHAALYLSGAVHLAYWLNRRRQLVLTYHNVLPDRLLDDSLHGMEAHAASVFARQLAIVGRRLPVTTELGQPGTCLITFDDGYRNNALVAEPLLRQAGARAFFFVPLETALEGRANWVDRFRLWLGAAPAGTYRIAGTEVVLGDAASRHRAAGLLWRLIDERYEARHAVLSDMEDAVPFAALPLDPELRALRYGAMSAAELRQLAETGHKIGAHSRRHDILSRLSASEVEDDFRHCAAQRGTLFNTDIYAYPFGGSEHLDAGVIAACRRAGFAAAFVYLPTLDGTGLEPGGYTMTRRTLPNTASRFAIEAKLSGAEDILRPLAHAARRLRHRPARAAARSAGRTMQASQTQADR